METKNIRSFEIEHTTFALTTENGHTCLRGAGAHWAIQDTDGSWAFFKGEHFRARLANQTPEQVAGKLLTFDTAHRAMLESLGITPA